MSRLTYFTIEDESMLAEAFSEFGEDVFAVTYKVGETDDVFVTTAETREAMDRHDVPYNPLAEEEASRVAVYHTNLSREELSDYEDAIKALALAYRTDLYTYFTAPAGHTFIWRIFRSRDEAIEFLDKLTLGDRNAVAWAKSIPLDSADELVSYH
jgi:hypothetical protein